ncbi:hypothetical protein JHK86_033447 [Glycine max]|nr:hypothetical protein JHK86_033447 [Glycine max]
MWKLRSPRISYMVVWEQNFLIASLKTILISLEKDQQWHRVMQVIKWMLSKGQGMTMGTYGQLIRALNIDHRVKEAQKFWEIKIGSDLHLVPWQLCHLMISVYYRNNMLQDLVKLCFPLFVTAEPLSRIKLGETTRKGFYLYDVKHKASPDPELKN